MKGLTRKLNNMFQVATGLQVVIFKKELAFHFLNGAIRISISRNWLDHQISKYERFKEMEKVIENA